MWELGPRAVVACGDALADPDLDKEALARRRDLARHRDSVLALIGFAIATHTTDQLLRALTASR